MRSILFYFFLFNICFGNQTFCQNLWKIIKSPTTQNLQKVVFVDSLTGWAVGDSGIVIHTLTFPNKNIGWALAWTTAPPYGTIILNTFDGGNSWKNQVFNGQDVFLNSIYFIDSLNGWIGGRSEERLN